MTANPEIIPRAAPTATVTPPVAPPPVVAPDAPIEYMPDETSEDTANRHTTLFVAGLVGFVCIAIVSIGVWFLSVHSMNAKQKESVAEVVTPTPIPTPTFVPTSITLDIRNASGVKGAANKLAKMLRSKGYTVVSVGNAASVSKSLLKTAISQSEVDALIADFGSTFLVSTVSGTPKDTTASAQLIIGKDWKE